MSEYIRTKPSNLPKRAVVSAYIDQELVQELDKLAAEDKRKRGNFAGVLLERAIRDAINKAPPNPAG